MPIAFQGGLSIPHFFYQSDNVVAFDTNHLIALPGNYIGFVVRAPKTGALHGFGFSAASFWSAAYTFRAYIYSVDVATGLPTGSPLAYGDFSGVTANTWCDGVAGMTDGGNATVLGMAGGDAFPEVNAGDLIACVIEYTGAVGGISMRTVLRNAHVAFPYAVRDTGSGWTRQVSTHTPILTLKYATDVDTSGLSVDIDSEEVLPLGSLAHRSERNFSDADRYIAAPDAASATFSLPWDTECMGVQIFANGVISATPSAFTVRIKNGSTVVASCDMDSDYLEDSNRGYFFAGWESVTLTGNTTYTLEITVTSGTIAIYERLFDQGAPRELGPGGATFAEYQGDSDRQLVFSLVMVPQSASAPSVMSRPALCGNAMTVDGCVTDVPDDPTIVADTPGTPGAAQAMSRPTDCGPTLTPEGCDPSFTADPEIVADTPNTAGPPAFSAALFLFGIGNVNIAAMSRPTTCESFAPAYCDAPTS